jgi:DNA-binding NtrC family response regulator
LTQEISNKFNFSKYIKGTSEPIQQIFQTLEKTANTNITVSITGETGTGKELIAKAIHFNSARYNRPFVAINMAAIPKELVESELFGAEKGAYTGAISTKIGKFEEANKGTLFLDEIAELDLLTQSKLLRALQEREINRLGSSKAIPIDVRIVIATHKDLQKEVTAGRFREDLYYRLMGVKVDLPPLRERRSDILLLAKHFLNEFSKENKMPVKSISKAAQDKLLNYPFPGNVRELKAVIEIAAVMCDQETIEPENLHLQYSASIGVTNSYETSLETYTLQIISSYLEKYNHNVVKVAEKLQIGKSTIYRFIKEGKINLK